MSPFLPLSFGSDLSPVFPTTASTYSSTLSDVVFLHNPALHTAAFTSCSALSLPPPLSSPPTAPPPSSAFTSLSLPDLSLSGTFPLPICNYFPSIPADNLVSPLPPPSSPSSIITSLSRPDLPLIGPSLSPYETSSLPTTSSAPSRPPSPSSVVIFLSFPDLSIAKLFPSSSETAFPSSSPTTSSSPSRPCSPLSSSITSLSLLDLSIAGAFPTPI